MTVVIYHLQVSHSEVKILKIYIVDLQVVPASFSLCIQSQIYIQHSQNESHKAPAFHFGDDREK